MQFAVQRADNKLTGMQTLDGVRALVRRIKRVEVRMFKGFYEVAFVARDAYGCEEAYITTAKTHKQVDELVAAVGVSIDKVEVR